MKVMAASLSAPSSDGTSYCSLSVQPTLPQSRGKDTLLPFLATILTLFLLHNRCGGECRRLSCLLVRPQ